MNYKDYMIIGAGPGGLQLGYFFEQKGRDYLIFEGRNRIGSFFERYPRNGKLISYNKISSIYEEPEIQLRWDWNSLLTNDYSFPFCRYSKRLFPKSQELIRYLADFAEQYALKIQYNTKIVHISKKANGLFALTDEKGIHYTCRCLIVASGFGKEYVPEIPGIELVTDSYGTVSMESDDFAGQSVLILGKGNSGFEIADNILDSAALIHLASPQSIRLAWNTKHPGHLRAHNTRLLDMYQLKMLHSVLDCEVNEIRRLDNKFIVSVTYTHAQGEVDELLFDRVIRCTGFQFDTSIFDASCQPALVIDDRLPDLTPAWESVNVPNLFFAGTLMQSRDFQRSSSAFIDGYRYNIRTLDSFLGERFHGEKLPGLIVEATAASLATAMLKRVCRTSGLWAQFSYLCDLIVVNEKTGLARYYVDLPKDYVHANALGEQEHYYTITFEWGPWQGDIFAIDRRPSHEYAESSAFLHPIVRRYAGTELVEEHHLLEDLFGMYCQARASTMVHRRSRPDMSHRSLAEFHLEEHEQPLQEFFERHAQ